MRGDGSMMISPESFANNLEGKSYQELRTIKDDLVAEIAEFERNRLAFAGNEFALPGELTVHPGPDVKYQMQLEYLAATCEKLSEQFNSEFEQ
jgi:hypothetical protein